MRNLSRLGWLHGMILFSAVVGCKGSGCTGGNCGPAQGGPAGGAPIISGPAGTGGVGYPKLFGSNGGPATSQGTAGGQTYPATTPGGQGAYPLPASSSTTYPGFGGQ